VDPDPHNFGNLDQHPDPHPYQTKKLDKKPNPHQLADDKPICMENEPFGHFFKGLSL
jgi:hypothetical protein